MNIPGNRRVMLADLASIDADVGSRVWVEGIGQYEAVPRDQKATNAIDGPADALTPISWQPEGMVAVTPAGSVAVRSVDATQFPGTTATAGVLAVGRGGKSASATALNADASAAVLAQALTGLGNSKVYVARLGIRVTIWKDATKEHCGNLDCTIDAHIATDGAGVATVTLATTPYFDPSLLVAGLTGAAATVAASAGGFTVSATRVAGIACSAKAAWWCVTLEDIT